MSNQNFDLQKTATWMQSVIQNTAGIQQYDYTNPGEVESVLTASKSLSAIERLAIYNRAYQFRLVECLSVQFPCLLHFLEDDLFNAFAKDYLEAYPSTSYTLQQLGAHFADHLAATRPDKDAPPDARESWPDFIIELAILERAFYEVYDGPGVEGQAILTLDQLSAMDAYEDLQLTPVPCLRLFTFHYPVNHYFREVRFNREPTLPPPAETFVVISRKDYIVRTYEVTYQQFEFLQALMQGKVVGDAMSRCQIEKSLGISWVWNWVLYGFFKS